MKQMAGPMANVGHSAHLKTMKENSTCVKNNTPTCAEVCAIRFMYSQKGTFFISVTCRTR